MSNKKNIEELLNSAKAYWVCPITGKQIEASNTSAIESHKIEILQKEKQKEIDRQRNKALSMLEKEFKNLATLHDFNEYIKNLINIKDPNFPPEKLPNFSVKSMKFSSDTFFTLYDNVALKINGLSFEVKKLLKNNLQNKVDANHTNEFFYVMKKTDNPLALAIYKFQVKASKNKIITVGVAEKALLAEHEKYPELLKKLQNIKADLHDLKMEHAIVDKEMASIREEVLNNKTFVENTTTSKKKMKA